MQKKRNTKNNTNMKRSSKQGKNGDVRSKTNDPSWYAVDPVIMRDAASFPFAHPAGVPVRLGSDFESNKVLIPGLMSFKVTPTLGKADDPSSPVNVAGTQLYAFIRHGNSGSVNYESGDLMLYALAMADAYSYVEFLKRAYGIVQLYAQRNRFMPHTIIESMGIDVNDLNSNLANFRLGINMLVNKLSSFAVPNTMSIFRRRAFLYQNVYTEGTSVKEQLYIMNPSHFGVYKWEEGKIHLVPFTVAGVNKEMGTSYGDENWPLFTIEQLLAFGNYMVDRIIANEDLGTMNGDILKVYGENIIKLAHLEEQYICVPVMDVNVLEQLKNATVIGGIQDDTLDIISEYSDPDKGTTGISILKSIPTVKLVARGEWGDDRITDQIVSNMGYLHAFENKLLTTDGPDPSPEMVMEMTRFCAFLVQRDNGLGTAYTDTADLYCGSEVITKVIMYNKPYASNQKDPEVNAQRYYQCVLNPQYIVNKTAAEQDISQEAFNFACDFYQSVVEAQSFKYAPLVSVEVGTSGSIIDKIVDVTTFNFNAAAVTDRLVGDVSNFTVVSKEHLQRLHEVALLNEFSTPHVAILK